MKIIELKAKTADGDTKPSPQSILDKLVGKLTFDPLAFARMEAKQQREVLAELSKAQAANADIEKQQREADLLNAKIVLAQHLVDSRKTAIASLRQQLEQTEKQLVEAAEDLIAAKRRAEKALVLFPV